MAAQTVRAGGVASKTIGASGVAAKTVGSSGVAERVGAGGVALRQLELVVWPRQF